MTDARLKQRYSLEGVTMDLLLLSSGVLDEREEMETAVRVALGTDALADRTEILPDPDSNDRRGWWADMDAELIWDGWPIGCKNWLLTRAKITGGEAAEGSTLARAHDYTNDALKWLIKKHIATRVDVEAIRTELQRIEVDVLVYRGPLLEIDLQYQLLWQQEQFLETPSGDVPSPQIKRLIRIPYSNKVLSGTSPIITRTFDHYNPVSANRVLSSVAPYRSIGIKRTSLQGNLVLSTVAPIVTVVDTYKQPARRDLVLSTVAPTVAKTLTNIGMFPPARNLLLSPQFSVIATSHFLGTWSGGYSYSTGDQVSYTFFVDESAFTHKYQATAPNVDRIPASYTVADEFGQGPFWVDIGPYP